MKNQKQNDLEEKIKEICDDLGLKCSEKELRTGQKYLLFHDGNFFYAVDKKLFEDYYSSIKHIIYYLYDKNIWQSEIYRR